jgi:Core-2/I-Branching enzyme
VYGRVVRAPVTTVAAEPPFWLQTWRGRGYSADVIGEGKAGAGQGTVAVVVLSHRAPAQVARLAARLAEDGRDTLVAIHHDPKGEPLALRASSSVALVPDPVPCPWGRSGINVAIRKSLEWLRANVPELSWVLVISGQDYPIRPMRSIEDELASAPCDAFMRYLRVDGDPADDVHRWQGIARQRYLYRRRLPGSARSVRLPWPRRHPFGDGFRLYAGEQWVNLSARAVHKVLDSPFNDRVLRYLRRSPNSDEAWLTTVALNGEPELTVVNDRRRYVQWPGGTPHPAVLGPDHLPALRESTAFFARKIDLDAWPQACDALDALAEARATVP